MARRLLLVVLAAVLLAALPTVARADWAEMVYYQDLVEAGGTVWGYAYTDLGYPLPSNPCPVYYYVYDCWEQYIAYVSANLYQDGMWRTGSEYWQPGWEAQVWVSEVSEAGQWMLESWHELNVQWQDWFDWWSWVNRQDYLYDYLRSYLQLNEPPPVVSLLVPSAAMRGEWGQVTIYGEHFG